MRLYLVRHGQTAWNVAGRAQGHADLPLDQVGAEQARQLASRFERTEISQVWSSDLARARQTAEALSADLGLSLDLRPELRERSFGDWEGLPYVEVRNGLTEIAERTGLDPLDVAPPGGESLRAVWERAGKIVEELHQSPEPTVIVTHGGTCGLLLAHLLGAGADAGKCFRFENTAVTDLERHRDGYWILRRFACTAHLVETSAPMIDAASPAVER